MPTVNFPDSEAEEGGDSDEEGTENLSRFPGVSLSAPSFVSQILTY